MKIQSLLFTLALLAGCSSPSGDGNSTAPGTAAANTKTPAAPAAAPATASTAGTAMASMPASSTSMPSSTSPASATGVVSAVDPVAKTITLDHGPVASLNWPAMTMTFKTGDLDLGSIKPGDHVAFEFTSNGMEATLTKIDRQ